MSSKLENVRKNHFFSGCLSELIEFVSLPNNVFDHNQIRNNADYLMRIMEKRGITVELFDTPANRPIIYGELLSPGATKTILIYSHYDGVPVEEEEWHSNPFEPVFRNRLPAHLDEDWDYILPGDFDLEELIESRVFARSIADSKNAIVACLSAIDYVREQGLTPKVNLKFLFDGEEEIESPSLKDCIANNTHKINSDLVISASGETHQSGLPTIELGFRGILQFNITAYTGVADLHSGHFGNFLPNAAFQLSSLVSSMKNEGGKVSIKGFYNQVVPLSDMEKNIIRGIPSIEAEISHRFGIAKAEIEGMALQELINLPTLNVRGISGGYVGHAARNIIPSHAVAELDIRLVKGMEPELTYDLIKKHIISQGWSVMEHTPTIEQLRQLGKIAKIEKNAGFPATRTNLQSREAEFVVAAVKKVFGEEIVIMPSEGGSLPLYIFEEHGTPVIGLPTSNFDCNQHTHDENLRVDYFYRAIETFSSLYTNHF
jgi:acetylornithine deacetylase/succinyl-diaminopimelate desuccinylase-like protein